MPETSPDGGRRRQQIACDARPRAARIAAGVAPDCGATNCAMACWPSAGQCATIARPARNFKKSHSLKSSSYAQHIELSFHAGIMNPYGPFNTYIPIRSTTIGKSRVARDPISMHTSWRSKSDIASVTSIGYPRMRASGESSTTKHRLLHASGSHPIPPPNEPKTNQYNQDLGLIHSKNGNHLESPNEGSSIDHQVTIHLHAQNITMFPTNETCGDVCTDIVVYSLAVERIPAGFRRIFAQGVYTENFVWYFSDSDVKSIPEIDSDSSDGCTVYRSPSPISQEADSSVPDEHFALGPVNFGAAQEEQSYYVQSPESPPPTFQHQVTSASSSGSPMHFTRDDIPLDATTDDLTSLPVGPTEFHTALDDLRAFILQRIDDSNNAHIMSDVQKIHLNEFKKVVLAQGVTDGADSLEIRKDFKALDAKINSLDGQIAAIRNEQLEFQTKIAADILSLSTQLGDIVDYIRGDDAKKGEGSSSRRPLPTPVHQSEGSGDVVRTTEISQQDIDNAQRDILERMMGANRERERESRSKSRGSESYKRRRY
ncbi:hypothetical protein F511_30042 [Dorcoceras hygrometricum]|uniref:Uncharacterized protein n=1 Tax=Dorcoceras hygrometricum TaxID=472368 RepID=A0A2Z7CRK0_9LAMI|nr:hypothetical protein F511_30042 [Dorcoceras hygrometricum]